MQAAVVDRAERFLGEHCNSGIDDHLPSRVRLARFQGRRGQGLDVSPAKECSIGDSEPCAELPLMRSAEGILRVSSASLRWKESGISAL